MLSRTSKFGKRATGFLNSTRIRIRCGLQGTIAVIRLFFCWRAYAAASVNVVLDIKRNLSYPALNPAAGRREASSSASAPPMTPRMIPTCPSATPIQNTARMQAGMVLGEARRPYNPNDSLITRPCLFRTMGVVAPFRFLAIRRSREAVLIQSLQVYSGSLVPNRPTSSTVSRRSCRLCHLE